MSAKGVKLILICNSMGIRIPKALLDRYGREDSLVLEEADDSVALRGNETGKLSWWQTYRSMACEQEDWSDFEVAAADGLD